MKIQKLFPVTNPTCHSRASLSGISTLLNNKKAAEVPDYNLRGRPYLTRGFTLIELLVVVLIIGVLSAIALPQYEKAVEKSKASQPLVLLNSLTQAARMYYLETGTSVSKFDDLAVNINWTGNTKARTTAVTDTKSNQDWSLQIYNPDGKFSDIYLTRLSGPYKGSGFFTTGNLTGSLVTDKIYCIEIKSNSNVTFGRADGDYCHKIFGGQVKYKGSGWTYELP